MFIVCSFSVMQNRNGNIEATPKCCLSRMCWLFKVHRQSTAKFFNTYFFLYIYMSFLPSIFRLFTPFNRFRWCWQSLQDDNFYYSLCFRHEPNIFFDWDKSDYFIHFHYIKIEKAYKICIYQEKFPYRIFVFSMLFSFRSFCFPFMSVLRNSLVLLSWFSGTKYFPCNFIYLYFVRSAKQFLNNIEIFHDNIHIDSHAFK